MSDTQTIACVDLPNPPQLTIALPFGVTLSAVADFSKGPPTNLALIQSLLVQLSPALAGMSCIFKMLNVMMAMKNISINSLPKVASAVAELSECFLFPAQIACMIVDILKLIVTFLLGIIESVESLLNFQLNISVGLEAAVDNPALQASLTCAQGNLATTSAQLQQSLSLITPILSIIQSLSSLAASIPGPVGKAMTAIPEAISTIGSVLSGAGSSSVSVSTTADQLKLLEQVRSTLAELQTLLAAVPC
jgi:hypothetical protein